MKLLAALSILLLTAESKAKSGSMLQSVLLDQIASLTKNQCPSLSRPSDIL